MGARSREQGEQRPGLQRCEEEEGGHLGVLATAAPDLGRTQKPSWGNTKPLSGDKEGRAETSARLRQTQGVGVGRAFLLETHSENTKARSDLQTHTKANHQVPPPLRFQAPLLSPGTGAAGPANHTGRWESSALPPWGWPRGWLGRKKKRPRSAAFGRHLPARGCPQEGDRAPSALPGALGSSGLEQVRQRKKRAST